MPALSAVTYFQSAFLPCWQRAAAAAYVVYQISDIRHCQKCGKYVPCTEHTAHGKDFELL